MLRPLYYFISKKRTIETTHVPFDNEGDPKDIENAIKQNTKFVIVTHCSNVLGNNSVKSKKRLRDLQEKSVFSLS